MADAVDSSTPQAPISTDAPPAAPAAVTSYDWKTSGIDDAGMVTITERGFKTPGDLLQSYRHLETATGVPPERLIKLPSAKDMTDPKAWDPIYAKLGRPETPDKYVLPLPAGDTGEWATAVKPWMHEAGLSQSQATKLAERWNAHLTAQETSRTTATEAKNLADVSALKQTWGAEYDQRAGVVDKAAETFGMTQEQVNGLKQSLGPKAAMEFLYNIGARLGVEDTSVPGIGGQSATFGGAMTPEMAQAEIQRLKQDRDFAQLFNSKDIKQKMDARQQMDRLQKMAYPGVSSVPMTSSASRRT